jgi:DNA-binding transcriptional regulator YiaG
MTTVAKKRMKSWTPHEIRKLRAALDLLQKEAAARVRISQQLWAGWERGYRTPSPSHRLLLDLLEAGLLPDDNS